MMKKILTSFLFLSMFISVQAQTKETKLTAAEVDSVWLWALVKQELMALEKQYDYNYICEKRECIAQIADTRKGNFKNTYDTYFDFIGNSGRESYYSYNQQLLDFLKLQNKLLKVNDYKIDAGDTSFVDDIKEQLYYNLYSNRDEEPWKSIPYLDNIIDKYLSLVKDKSEVSQAEMEWLIAKMQPKGTPMLNDKVEITNGNEYVTPATVKQVLMYPLERKFNREKLQEIDECLYLKGIYDNKEYDELCDMYHKFYNNYYDYNNRLKSLLQDAKGSDIATVKNKLTSMEYYVYYSLKNDLKTSSIDYLDGVIEDFEYILNHEELFTDENIDDLIQCLTIPEDRDKPYVGSLRSFGVSTSAATENNTSEVEEVEYKPLEAVDMGLSVKWASYNLGANCPEDFGDYFSWGELGPKNVYQKDTYQYYEMNIGKNIANSEYDVATAKLGSDWHIPTRKEIDELIDKCDWTWTTVNDVKGYRVTAPNGNCIFLPAGGFCYPYSSKANEVGQYWSSDMANISTAFILDLRKNQFIPGTQSRLYGISIRAVCNY